MKLFIDSASVAEIREVASWGVLDGVTTNPSLVAKEKKPFRKVLEEILQIVNGPVSAEVVSTEMRSMVEEGRALSKLHRNIVVKIPMLTDGLKAVKVLSQEGIRTNVTLCFSPTQALLAAKAGASYISPFIGRLDDISHVGMDIIRQIKAIYGNYGIKTEILAASLRHPVHVLEAALVGAHVSTAPFSVLEKLVKHPLTDIGLARFLADWQNLPEDQRNILGRAIATSAA